MSFTDPIIQKKTDTAIKFDIGVQFPEIIDDKINTEEFLQAARDVVRTVGMSISNFNLKLSIIAERSHKFCFKHDTIREH